MAIEEKKYLGTAGVERLISKTRSEIAAAEAAAKKYADDLGVNYDAAGTAETKVNALANGQVKTNTEHIGTMDNLETTAKGDLVAAINEVRNAVSVGGTAAALTMEEKSTGLGDGVLKAYVLKQGENTVGTINIPKDMVVQSGEVVVNPEGQAEGTYIKLVLANATNDVIYVNVGNLVDIYKAKANAAQVQIAIDSATREVSASIVAGSISDVELAANAVVTAKIADGNVTKAKLSSEVQASLDKADAAAQGASDAAAQALADAKSYVDGKDSAMNTRVEALEAIDHDHANKAKLDTYDKTQSELLAAAKSEAEALNTAMNTRVEALEAIDHEHANMEELNKISSGDVAKWNGAQAAAEATAKSYTDGKDSAMNARVEALEAIDHDHANMEELGKIASGDVAKWNGAQAAAEAAAKSYTDGKDSAMNARVEALEAIDHDHSNKTQLDSYDKTQTELLAAAESTAKSYADGLNTAMNTRVEALENVSYVEITAADIDAMFAAE